MNPVNDQQDSGQICPFDPRPGVVPRVWSGGRSSMLAAFSAEMNHAEAGQPSRSPLFVGSTGLGKSALLTWSVESAVERGWPAIRLIVSGDVKSPPGFARALNDAVAKLRAEGSVLERAKKVVRKIPVRPQLPYLEYAPRAISTDTELIENAFRSFDAFVTELRVPGLIAIDEIHKLDGDTAEALIHWLADERGSNVRLVAAGLSSAWPLLTMETMSLGPRVFKPYELTPLSVEQSRNFLQRALASVDVSWPEHVLDRVSRLSWGALSNLHELGYKLWHVQERFLDDPSGLERFLQDLERELVRDVKRRLGSISPTAQKILRELPEGEDGLSLLKLRMIAGEDESEFRKAMDQLETAGLANLDPDQDVRAVGPPGALAAIAGQGTLRRGPSSDDRQLEQ